MPRHRICSKCLDSIEAKDPAAITFHVQQTYPGKNKGSDDTRDYQERTLRQKIMSKHFRVAEYKRRKAAEEFEINKKLKEGGGGG